MFRRGQQLRAEQLNELDARTRQGMNLMPGPGVQGMISEFGRSLAMFNKGVKFGRTVSSDDYPTQDASPESDLADVGEDCIANYPFQFVDIDYDNTTVGNSCREVTLRGREYVLQNIYGDWIPPGIDLPVFEHRGRYFTAYQAGLAAFCCDSSDESDSQSESDSASDSTSQTDPSGSDDPSESASDDPSESDSASNTDGTGSDSGSGDPSGTDGTGSGSDSGTDGTGSGSGTDGTDGTGSGSGSGTDGTDGTGSGSDDGTGTDGTDSGSESDGSGTDGTGSGSSSCYALFGVEWDDIPESSDENPATHVLGFDSNGCLVRIPVGDCDDSGSGSGA